jgi:hypothetical protein
MQNGLINQDPQIPSQLIAWLEPCTRTSSYFVEASDEITASFISSHNTEPESDPTNWLGQSCCSESRYHPPYCHRRSQTNALMF